MRLQNLLKVERCFSKCNRHRHPGTCSRWIRWSKKIEFNWPSQNQQTLSYISQHRDQWNSFCRCSIFFLLVWLRLVRARRKFSVPFLMIVAHGQILMANAWTIFHLCGQNVSKVVWTLLLMMILSARDGLTKENAPTIPSTFRYIAPKAAEVLLLGVPGYVLH